MGRQCQNQVKKSPGTLNTHDNLRDYKKSRRTERLKNTPGTLWKSMKLPVPYGSQKPSRYPKDVKKTHYTLRGKYITVTLIL